MNIESPYKAGAPSPLRRIPGGDDPSMVKVDLMHTFHIGFGGDLSSSTIIALARMGAFGSDRKLQHNLDQGFVRFETWCSTTHKTAHIKSFELKKFHMQSFLGTSRSICFLCLSPWDCL